MIGAIAIIAAFTFWRLDAAGVSKKTIADSFGFGLAVVAIAVFWIMHREIARNNGARIIADPHLALDAITHQQSTFTRRDMAKFAHRHSDGIDQFNEVMGAMRGSPDLVELGQDGRGEDRFTTRDMIEAEQRLHRAAEMMAERERHAVNEADRQGALARAEQHGLVLSGEQADALAYVTDGRDLGIVVGYAGTGKSAMLGVAREAWESAGYTVRGAALSGIAAEGLEHGSGIGSRTIASLEHQWGQGRELLTSRDVLVIDEAGMVGTRQMERLLSHAADAGAKVVLVGDPQQLQAIEAGAAFRSIHERHGGVEISEVRRQHEGWQQDATRHLATGRTGLAIQAYGERGMVHDTATRDAARGELIERWDRDRQASPGDTRIILTHTNDEVRELNDAARGKLRASGELGDDVTIRAERGERQFASGDRIMFLRNERGLGVKNGTLGTVERISAQSMAVRTDDGRSNAGIAEQPAQRHLAGRAADAAGNRGGHLRVAEVDLDGVPLVRADSSAVLAEGEAPLLGRRDDLVEERSLDREPGVARALEQRVDVDPAGVVEGEPDGARGVPEHVREMFADLDVSWRWLGAHRSSPPCVGRAWPLGAAAATIRS